MEDSLLKHKDETDKEYGLRLAMNKDIYGISWTRICDLMFEATGVRKDESAYRKYYMAFIDGMDYQKNKDPSEQMDELMNKELDVKLETVKMRDYRAALNRDVNKIARFDMLKQDISDYVIKNHLEFNDNKSKFSSTEKSAILCLSDFHYGMVTDNYLNKYNPEIFHERMTKLFDAVVKKIYSEKIGSLYVINLNDAISGYIHNTIRIENRKNVIEQVMEVSNALAEFLNGLSQHCNIEYYSVIDNHSRCIANKYDSLQNENFSLLVDWYLKAALRYVHNIHINENEFDNDILTFSIYNWNYLGSHGDKDSIHDIVQNMTLLTHKFYDAMFIAHKHHVESKEVDGTMVFMNGSLCGTDNYAKSLRITSHPSQTMYIVTPDNPYESINIIRLD